MEKNNKDIIEAESQGKLTDIDYYDYKMEKKIKDRMEAQRQARSDADKERDKKQSAIKSKYEENKANIVKNRCDLLNKIIQERETRLKIQDKKLEHQEVKDEDILNIDLCKINESVLNDSKEDYYSLKIYALNIQIKEASEEKELELLGFDCSSDRIEYSQNKINKAKELISKYSKIIQDVEENNELKCWKILIHNDDRYHYDSGILITFAKTEKNAYEFFLENLYKCSKDEYYTSTSNSGFMQELLNCDIEEVPIENNKVITFKQGGSYQCY